MAKGDVKKRKHPHCCDTNLNICSWCGTEFMKAG